jgi:general stress protein 26
MKVRTQTSESTKPLAEALEDHRTVMLTLPENGALTSRPMTALEMDATGDIWMMTSRRTLAPLVGSGGVDGNLALMDDEKSSYVSIACRVALIDDPARKEALWSAVGRPWFKGPDDPDLTLLRLTPQQAEIWDGPHGSLTRVLAIAASVIAGREVGLGDKKVVTPSSAR